MTQRRPCPAAPGPLEGYAARFDDLFGSWRSGGGFREYLAGLLAPRDRNKTLTALGRGRADHRSAAPGGAAAAVLPLRVAVGSGAGQRPEAGAAASRSGDCAHGGGVLVIDDSGDRQGRGEDRARGPAVAGPVRQDRQRGGHGYHACGPTSAFTIRCTRVPYTPARHFAKGKNDPAFRTKLAIGAGLAIKAREAGFVFRAVVADLRPTGTRTGFRAELAEAGLAVRDGAQAAPRDCGPATPDAHTPVDAARALGLGTARTIPATGTR